MIINLPDTDTRVIARQLVTLRETGGIVTTGRVLTLIVLAQGDDDLETIIKTVNSVSREHPARVLVLVAGEPRGASRLDAELRLGGDAGAAEVVVMHMEGEVGAHPEAIVTPLLLPDTPVVAWWPSTPPQVPAATPIGQIAQRRITDSLADPDANAVYTRRTGYTPGDSDLAWSRLTAWRGVLASALDSPPHGPITAARIEGPGEDPSVDVAAGWLADRLAVPVLRVVTDEPEVPVDADGVAKPPVTKVTLSRPGEDGTPTDVIVEVENATTACVTIMGSPPFKVALSRRTTVDCLAEELRHLDPDTAYARALRGLGRIRRLTAQQAREAEDGSLDDGSSASGSPSVSAFAHDPEESSR
ncbi:MULTISPECIES: glucose-6-phosphate dehydrogenase assembly protein OpcA [Corynebacterium]|uniref:glucose-6-phosphate dehydrogenase assembly protein OpcA n=1 Tax=Corynebacterium TaxID=1716 RepID=UPI0008A49C7A|nr:MULTISPECIES: glucose-6-phosphate dehydrogenase assembly protein OpcA [Corynebacterium]MCG7438003.1 glucose-6-phosphate dehydrogenase assembly protein OpcA [Corynebacterium freneyi]OFU53552.1 oxppcycle protein OpcA [Corynebacterium sp. HMSC11E11]UBI01272.1 glucose-6-phosphate dehydrogenase assembly protein OpcA [Corynebacterium freneyi]